MHWIARRKIDAARRRVQQTSDLHLATIEALARAIDAKDQTAEFHLQRVQAYAVGLARAIALPPNDVEAIKTAALLHDIGKLAIPEHILSKPGPLTAEEFQKVRRHSQVGADILAGVPFPYPVTPLIRSHHERWDGKGYPAALKGEEIPIGARILAIVDYFDAVTTDRPYHKAHSYETAIALLKQEAGLGFDARLVEIFIELLPRFTAEFAATRSSVTSDRPGADAAAPGPLPPGPPHSVFEDIALANREIYALYEIAQSLGTSLGVADTMALISSQAGEHRALVELRALSLQPRRRHARVPVRGWRRRLPAAQPHVDRRRRAVGMGLAAPAHADPNRPRRGLPRRGAGHDRRVGPGVPADRQPSVHRHAWALPSSSATDTRRIIAGCSSRWPHRRPPSFTIRSCSSRPRPIRSPTR